ncbi:MAG: leucyl/phenylalanyl-tRNA--protein transferase, partial [Bdellovibrionales bacterium]|nr:leucyl/phenylalanyl-tRNA--protein transferase [Bdellovibrionales bacterium]
MNIRKPIPTDKVNFPDPWLLPEESDGLIYIGGNLSVETLLKAYRSGIFPWPLEPAYPLFWFCPEPRGILEFHELHAPRSLEKLDKKSIYRFTYNRRFRDVMEACARQKRPGQEGTWILPSMIPAYERLHQEGWAHSIECWRGDDLVGGLYGVGVDGVFSGESMFHGEPNTSKLCLLHMARKLRGLGMEWMDIQMVTPVTESLGGKYVPRREFLTKLR